MLHPRGMHPFVAGWDTVARSLLQRVHREATGHVIDHDTKLLLDALLAYPDVPRDWKAFHGTAPGGASMPVIPLSFVHDGTTLRYFSMVTSIGAPQTIAAQELRLECMFPADGETERWHGKTLPSMRRIPDSDSFHEAHFSRGFIILR